MGARPELLVFPYGVADGATHMATDESLMDFARAGHASLRFYGWEPWCLSLGRHQAAPDLLLGRPRSELRVGLDVVRRPTGGRSVFHGPEITYALTCPDRAWGGPRAIYERVHRALGLALASFGVELDLATSAAHGSGAGSSRGRVSRAGPARLGPGPGACFRHPAPGEITVQSRKLVGSAQWRHRSAILQHGSILLSNHQARGELSGPARASRTVREAIGLDELFDTLPRVEQLTRRCTDAIVQELCGRGWDRAEREEIPPVPERLLARYRSHAWQWRVRAVRTRADQRPTGSGRRIGPSLR